LVAEKVMGLRRHDPSPNADNLCWERADEPYESFELPPYSTDIAAAWEVVEKLKTLRDDLKIELSSGSEHPNEWEVAVSWYEQPEDGIHGPFYFTAPTAPHAICLAALKAVGAEP
jgi:hypothetical protein